MRVLYLALFLSISGQAEEFNPRTDVIADNYDAGQFLIYDCSEKHWTCVTQEYFDLCQAKRNGDAKNLNSVYHSCAPVGEFPTKKSCYQRQLFLVTHAVGDRFCIKDEWKQKSISRK